MTKEQSFIALVVIASFTVGLMVASMRQHLQSTTALNQAYEKGWNEGQLFLLRGDHTRWWK